MKLRIRFQAAVASLLAVLSCAFATSGLAPGSPAPALKVAKWVKGSPVPSFEKGKIYVVEFWATWCGPCKAAFPHLTELAKKYEGKVTFAGVSVRDSEDDARDDSHVKRVAAFVKEQGANMGYTVGVDSHDNAIWKNWMVAAGQTGIPCAFVVDRTGTIAWIGHPSRLEEALPRVIDGTLDIKGEAELEAATNVQSANRRQLMSTIFDPAKAGDFQGAIEALDKVISDCTDPDDRQRWIDEFAGTRYEMMLHYDAKAANAYARTSLETTHKNDWLFLTILAEGMVSEGIPIEADTKLAIDIAKRCVQIAKQPLAASLSTLSMAYYRDGQIDKAIETCQSAIKAMDGAKGIGPGYRKVLIDQLEKFKKG